MNGRTIAMVGLLAVALLAPAMVEGAIVQRTYSFTGADLINNVFVNDGLDDDGSTTYFEGARKLTLGETHYRSYVVDQHGNFNTTWSSLKDGNAVLNHFYLWGHNGFAPLWGEYYKPVAWVSGTAPEGWKFNIWRNEIAYWSYGTGGVIGGAPVVAAGGLSVNASPETLAAMEFSITVQFDTDDMWWADPDDDDYKAHGGNEAPNDIDEGLTMWFGSRIYKIVEGNQLDSTYYRYQGNMYATAIPEPASIAIWLLMLLGFIGVACRRPRRGVPA